MDRQRVVVAMSGGVDSSVAAALLQKKGYEVIGMTMCFNLADGLGKRPRCCGLQGIEDARRVAHALGIKHYVVNMQKVLDERVIEDFCREYLAGRTPNPCVRCNQFVKFDALLKKALALGAAYLATGHYARIAKARSTGASAQVFKLKKARDLKKDQSYFLYRIGQAQLKHVMFPLGNLTKVAVRELARQFKLPVAEKLDSQEICFLPDNNYRAFLERRCPSAVKPGPIVDTKGKMLGEHKGVAFYTVGQRGGLGIALGYPAYVVKIDPKKNRVVLSKNEDAWASNCVITKPHYIGKPINKDVALRVRIRYNHKEALADITPGAFNLRICFREPQFAITPGQSAVVYDKDVVLGGGIIDKVEV